MRALIGRRQVALGAECRVEFGALCCGAKGADLAANRFKWQRRQLCQCGAELGTSHHHYSGAGNAAISAMGDGLPVAIGLFKLAHLVTAKQCNVGLIQQPRAHLARVQTTALWKVQAAPVKWYPA